MQWSSPRGAVAEHVSALVFFAAATVVMTWPLATNLGFAVAYPGDPLINSWILDWDWYATFHRPLQLFQANVLWPARYSLAFSEHLYGIAVLAFPLRALGMPPLMAHNVMLMLGFLLTAYGGFLLGLTVTRSWSVSIVGGSVLGFLPWRFTHLTQLQHAWVLWLVLLPAALIWYARSPSWRRAAAFGLVFLMNGLTNLHWMAFGSLAIALSVVVSLLVVPSMRRPPALLRIAAVTLCAGLLLVPFLLPYRSARALYGMRGDRAETEHYSAILPDWVRTNFHTRIHRALGWNDGKSDPERWLFPGFLPLALAAAALAARRREHDPLGGSLALLWILLGIIGSLGLHSPFHRFLFEHVELFKGIRVPARWAMVAYVGMSCAAAIGTMVLLRDVPRRWRPFGGVIIAVLVLFELRAAPIRWRLIDPRPPAVHRWLANAPPRTVVLELPVDGEQSEFEAVFRSTAHHRPIVNGVTDFVPFHLDLARRFAQASVPADTIDRLLGAEVTHIIVHAETLEKQEQPVREFVAREVAAGRLGLVERFDAGMKGDYLFAIGRSGTVDDSLQRFIDGRPTRSEIPFGALDSPREGERFAGPLRISGWALAAAGIKSVEVRLGNGAQRHPAWFFARPDVLEAYPWYGAPQAGFEVYIAARPEALDPLTDVEVVITDNAGRVAYLPNRWITWER